MSRKAGVFVLGAILLGIGSVLYTGFSPTYSYWLAEVLANGILFIGVGILFIAVSVLAKER